ncbi:MAG: hypothetical protein FJ090_08870 [Deltaproteobacteria bacterium]|nr:hypothetical protein [Deltaproteobacteria bacterium]
MLIPGAWAQEATRPILGIGSGARGDGDGAEFFASMLNEEGTAREESTARYDHASLGLGFDPCAQLAVHLTPSNARREHRRLG